MAFFVPGVKHPAKSNFGKERLILVCSLSVLPAHRRGEKRGRPMRQQAGHIASEVEIRGEMGCWSSTPLLFMQSRAQLWDGGTHI